MFFWSIKPYKLTFSYMIYKKRSVIITIKLIINIYIFKFLNQFLKNINFLLMEKYLKEKKLKEKMFIFLLFIYYLFIYYIVYLFYYLFIYYLFI